VCVHHLQGAACVARFWLPGQNTTCPYRPPLRFESSITTFFTFPGDTAQQPSAKDLQGGNWCRFESGGAWLTGYVREKACHAAGGESSSTFELFCPFVTNSCADACNVKGLVDNATCGSCSCDYWCQLYGDCCGQGSDIAAQCPEMTPTLDFARTRNCSARAGLAAQQPLCGTAAGSFRPSGAN
jgi:hypothetical protein